MIYYIADLHLFHEKVIVYDGRPFEDSAEMKKSIVQNWNERVLDSDIVYVLGDAFFKNGAESVEIIQTLKGHKHLIRGNHDRVGVLGPYWESVRDYAEIRDGGRTVVLSHYPMPFYNHQHEGAVMLYGHVHNSREWEMIQKWKDEMRTAGIPARLINVGCMIDYMNYAPRTLDELLAAAL